MLTALASSVLQAVRGEITLQQAADIGQIVAGLMSVVFIASAWLLWRQVRLQVLDSKTELVTGMTALITTVGQAFIDYPEMRQYFYEGVSPEGCARERALAITVALAGAMDHIAANFERMEPATREAWQRYFTYAYDNSPVLRVHLQDHASWYGPEFREYFRI
jgi:hypothetical protein